ncbi:MAG: TIM barrel protein [Verrucomicrobia bacterium]|nr:TIM barrel protein [Verrucomicrobiota bacterium]
MPTPPLSEPVRLPLDRRVTRRTVIQGALAAGAGILASSSVAGGDGEAARAAGSATYHVQHGRIRQSVVPWCFRPMTLEELCGHAARLGLTSVELVTPDKFPVLRQHGLICALTGSHGFAKGFAHVEEHAECLRVLRERIDATAAAGFPAVITFSGFRRGLPEEVGMKNMVDGLKQIAGYAEQRRVTLCLEMLNSRVREEMKGHPDYFCDDIDRAVEICRRVGSERVKVLFDIYHVQIMHGDVITRIRQHREWIGHYHTAGVPGRNEIDETQELNYGAVMRAIVETGYRGHVGQEFVPLRDKVASLSQAVRICDV